MTGLCVSHNIPFFTFYSTQNIHILKTGQPLQIDSCPQRLTSTAKRIFAEANQFSKYECWSVFTPRYDRSRDHPPPQNQFFSRTKNIILFFLLNNAAFGLLHASQCFLFHILLYLKHSYFENWLASVRRGQPLRIYPLPLKIIEQKKYKL